MGIIYPLYLTGFLTHYRTMTIRSRIYQEKKCSAQSYIFKTEIPRFSDLKKRVENDYVLNKAEYPRTVTAVQSLIKN